MRIWILILGFKGLSLLIAREENRSRVSRQFLRPGKFRGRKHFKTLRSRFKLSSDFFFDLPFGVRVQSQESNGKYRCHLFLMAARDDLNNWDRLVESWGGHPGEVWPRLYLRKPSKANPVRLRNSTYFCVFKYKRAVKQKVWNESENRERDWGETLKIRTPVGRVRLARFARVRLLRHALPNSLLILGKKRTVLQSKPCLRQKISLPILRQETLFHGPDSFSFCVQYKVIF